MKLAQLFSDFEEALIREGEEPESLSFVYRSLKNLAFTDFVFALQQEVTEDEKQFVEEIYQLELCQVFVESSRYDGLLHGFVGSYKYGYALNDHQYRL